MKQQKHKRPVPKQLAAHTFANHPENINRKGRPEVSDALRKLAVEVANEIIHLTPKERKKLSIKEQEAVTRLKRMLYDQAMSNDWHKQQLFLERAFGKVSDKLDINGLKEIHVTINKPDADSG